MSDRLEDALRAAMRDVAAPAPGQDLGSAVVGRVRRYKRRRNTAVALSAAAVLTVGSAVVVNLPSDQEAPVAGESTLRTRVVTPTDPGQVVSRWPQAPTGTPEADPLARRLYAVADDASKRVIVHDGAKTFTLPASASDVFSLARVGPHYLVQAGDRVNITGKGPSALMMVRDSGEVIPLAAGAYGQLTVSPDGRRFALATSSGNGTTVDVYGVDAPTRKTLSRQAPPGFEAVWSSSGWTSQGILGIIDPGDSQREVAIFDPDTGKTQRLGPAATALPIARNRSSVVLLRVADWRKDPLQVTAVSVDLPSGRETTLTEFSSPGGENGKWLLNEARLNPDGNRLLVNAHVHLLDRPGERVQLPFNPDQLSGSPTPMSLENPTGRGWGYGTTLLVSQPSADVSRLELGQCDYATPQPVCTRVPVKERAFNVVLGD